MLCRHQMLYVSSAISCYFPYDMCLYKDMSALVSYALRYLPLFTAVLVCPTVLMVRSGLPCLLPAPSLTPPLPHPSLTPLLSFFSHFPLASILTPHPSSSLPLPDPCSSSPQASQVPPGPLAWSVVGGHPPLHPSHPHIHVHTQLPPPPFRGG